MNNNIPSKFIETLKTEYNLNTKLQNQLTILSNKISNILPTIIQKKINNTIQHIINNKDDRNKVPFGELKTPPFYGFNTFNTECSDYELPLIIIKGLRKIGLVKSDSFYKKELINKVNQMFVDSNDKESVKEKASLSSSQFKHTSHSTPIDKLASFETNNENSTVNKFNYIEFIRNNNNNRKENKYITFVNGNLFGFEDY
ncbi:hypothetical protein CDIK_4442 [Cucumispora dikerogammari]|nr:hypothetical protein CDIK_4442 [Cucumispora dikerogammari]